MKEVGIKLLRTSGAFLLNQYAVIIFTILTGCKIFLFNTYVIEVMGRGRGIISGFLSAALIFLPLYFITKYKTKISLIVAFTISLLLFIDTVYFSYYNTLPSIGLLGIVGQINDVSDAIIPLIEWWHFFFFIDILLFLIFHKQITKFKTKMTDRSDPKPTGFKPALIITILICILSWIAIQPIGGISKFSELFKRGYDIIYTSRHYGFIVAHGMDVVRFVNQETTRLSHEEQQKITDWTKTNNPDRAESSLFGVAKNKNIIMIQVESLGGFVINQRFNGKEITPNLNSLSKQAHYYPHDRFLYGGGHTSDTDLVANTSFFPIHDTAIFVRYGNADFTSLPKILTKKGYSAYAYHGYNRNFWNRDIAYRSLGYQKFFAADNYPKGAKINMGLNDGDFLDKTADLIKKQPKPSLSYVVTLSSHSPFNTYRQTEELGVNLSDYPDPVGGYLENINYTDRMLGKFFDQLKKDDLYNDSLIVVYGDHTPALPKFSAGTINYDPDTVQMKEVPLFIKLPNQTSGQVHNKEGTHLDIMPTILDLTGTKTSQLMFGRNLFSNDLKICMDQFAVFPSEGDCVTQLDNEKLISSKIIRYNQFNKLPR